MGNYFKLSQGHFEGYYGTLKVFFMDPILLEAYFNSI